MIWNTRRAFDMMAKTAIAREGEGERKNKKKEKSLLVLKKE